MNHRLSGKKFGAMTVIEKVGSDNGAVMSCRCDCGSVFKRKANSIVQGEKLGKRQSCGCTEEYREVLLTGKRTCPKCSEEKSACDFSKSTATSFGLQNYCKSCCSEWRSDNKEYLAKTKREYHEKNRESIAERKKAYMARTKSETNRRSREWRERNPEKRRIVANNYVRRNPQKMAAAAAARRAVKLSATPAWSDPNEIGKIYEKARFLNALGERQFHVDHIVPLKSELVCGLHCESNLQIIWADENQSKGNRYWPGMPHRENEQ